MRRLLAWRALAGAAIALVLWMYTPTSLSHWVNYAGWGFLVLLLLSFVLSFATISERLQLALQFCTDIVLAACLVFATGGIDSPFAFLFGLIIIASGSVARFMLPLLVSILACAGYLAAVYSALWRVGMPVPDTDQALHILLQVSALMLVGGIMAAIARRHASLSESSARVLVQHRKLIDLHDKLMDAMREGVIVLDRQLELSDMNSAAASLLAGRPVSVLTAIPAMSACLHGDGSASCQCEYVCGERTLLVAGTPLTADDDAAWLLSLVDISDAKAMQLQMMEQEKMAVMGRMASMLAHEIRNPIHTIAQGLAMLPTGAVKGVNIRDILHEEVLRLNRLVSTMLNYSQPLLPAPDYCFMPSVIRGAVNQFNLYKPRPIDVRCMQEQLLLDADHFRMILDNLLDNAVKNSPPDSPIHVQLDVVGEQWRLQVCNSGTLSDAVAENMFEPFVSGHSHGIGLGLATVTLVCEVNGWQAGVEQGIRGDKDQVCFTVQGRIEEQTEAYDSEVIAHG